MKNNRSKFEPYSRNTPKTTIQETRRYKADILEDVVKLFLANKSEEAEALYSTIQKSTECTCDGWGCLYCKTTEADIRASQGVFG